MVSDALQFMTQTIVEADIRAPASEVFDRIGHTENFSQVVSHTTKIELIAE